MTYPRTSWFRLADQSTKLALEAQEVVALRLMRLAQGGPRAAQEATHMVAEKMTALAQMQMMMLFAAGTGRAGSAPARAVAMYRRKVQANRRRLRQTERGG